MKNRIEKMQEYTESAISAMNVNNSFEQMEAYLDEAFALCSPTEDLAYYQVMATVFTRLTFKTKTAIGTSKVKQQYILLYEYIDEKFANIINFNANVNSKDEVNIVNSICCDIYNGLSRYYLAFYNASMNAGSIWGLVGIGIAHATFNKFRKHINSIAKNAAYILKKYHPTDAQILDNIKEFESGI